MRPGYRPPEDQEKYRNRIVEARSKIGTGGVAGAEPTGTSTKGAEKNKNAKRREAARKKAAAAASAAETQSEDVEIRNITNGVQKAQLQASETDRIKDDWRDPSKLAMNKDAAVEAKEAEEAAAAAEKEKKARSLKKKLRQSRGAESCCRNSLPR